jgi:hypothetical protein
MGNYLERSIRQDASLFQHGDTQWDLTNPRLTHSRTMPIVMVLEKVLTRCQTLSHSG